MFQLENYTKQDPRAEITTWLAGVIRTDLDALGLS